MRRWIAVVVMLVGIGCLPGCINPPEGTVFVDLNGDGTVDALAADVNQDGVPDTDAGGRVLVIPGSEGYKTAEAVDSIVPEILMWTGAAFGIPVLVGIGAAWKGSRWGRIFMNTVMSVQKAREDLKEWKAPNAEEALAVVDKALEEVQRQYPQTKNEVLKTKEALGLYLKQQD